MKTIRRQLRMWMIVILLVTLAGCGSLGEVALQSGEVGLRTLIDLFLTDFTNQVADAMEQDNNPPADEVDDNDDVSSDDPVINGEMIFAANGCMACHCAGASGGCALEAPSLVGVGADTLDVMLRGDGSHPGGKFDFDDQDVADLEASMNSL